MSIYVTSDIHGCYELLIAGLNAIGFSDSDFLYVDGDAIDRGPDGIKTLQYIKDHDNMDLLIGNHEYMMIMSVDPEGRDMIGGPNTRLWLKYNGGTPTSNAYSNLTDKERKDLLSWLNTRLISKTLTVNNTRFCITHTYFVKNGFDKTFADLSRFAVENAVWYSPFREEEYVPASEYEKYGYTFITGHVPVQRLMSEPEEVKPNVYKPFLINIDGGCAFEDYHLSKGVKHGLLFIKLEDMSYTFIDYFTKEIHKGGIA